MKDQFMRIAMARLRSVYPFKPQRSAVAAKMWVRFVERNNTAEKIASWRKEEDALNRRMNIVGQNGNTGEHYEKPH
jgi:phosphate-selective porin